MYEFYRSSLHLGKKAEVRALATALCQPRSAASEVPTSRAKDAREMGHPRLGIGGIWDGAGKIWGSILLKYWTDYGYAISIRTVAGKILIRKNLSAQY